MEYAYGQLLRAYLKSDFSPIRPDSGQVLANLEAACDQWHEVRRTLASLPSSTPWQPKGDVEYLAVTRGGYDNAATKGVRSAETAALYDSFVVEKVLAPNC